MRTDASISVSCDVCETYMDEIFLAAVACGGFDQRYVNHKLERMGWVMNEGKDICPDCADLIPIEVRGTK
jgi:hypothetical protein